MQKPKAWANMNIIGISKAGNVIRYATNITLNRSLFVGIIFYQTCLWGK